MRLQQFPRCCGADILTDLEFIQNYVYGNFLHPYGTYRNFYKTTGEKILGYIKRARSNNRGAMYAVANYHQRKMVAFLKKFGFKLVEKFNNPRHGSRLSLIKLNVEEIDNKKFDRLKKMVSKMKN